MMENELSSPRITASTVLSGSVSPIAPGSHVVKHRRPRRAGLLKWIPSDQDQFIRTENVVLQPVSGFYEQKEIASLNTIYYMHKPGAQKGLHSTPKETAQNEPPLLLFHGFGTGLGLWSICWMDLLQMGDVYAIDLPGLAGSKRFPYNGKNHKDAIQYFLQHISAWVHESKIATPFRVMGHSLGGYIAANFARAFPEWVTEVILVDPWGVPCAKENDKRMDRLPTGLKVALTVAHVVSPLAVVRSLGPLGPNLFLKSRRRITERYRHMLTDTKALGDYLYHCNTFEPTGEAAFRQLTNNRLTAYEPISDWLLKELKPGIRVAFIYGQNTWIDYSAGEALVKKKNETHGHTHTSYKGSHDLYWQVNIIPNAGHNVFVDQPLSFVRCVTQFLYHGDPPPYPRQSIVPLSIPSPPHPLVRSETMPIFNEQQDV